MLAKLAKLEKKVRTKLAKLVKLAKIARTELLKLPKLAKLAKIVRPKLHLFLRFYSILPESRDLLGFHCSLQYYAFSLETQLTQVI